MKKAMLSQPMAGKTDAEIVATRERAIAYLESLGYEVVNTLFTDEWYSREQMAERGVVQIPLCFLAKSLENMSLCHAAYFAKGWENARGCRIEHDAAVAYGLEVLYEDDGEALREKAERERTGGWISVEDRLPHFNQNYIVCRDDSWCSMDEGIWYQSDVLVIADFYNGTWTWNDGGAEYSLEDIVTHWQPLPKPPKGAQE